MAKLRSDSEEEYAARKARVRAAAKKARKQADRENIKRTAKDVGKELAVDAAVGLATAGSGTIARAVGKGARMAAKGIRGARAAKGRKAAQKIARMPTGSKKLNKAAGKVSVKAVKAQKKKTGQTLSEARGSVQRNKLMDKAKAKVKAGNLRQDKIEKAGKKVRDKIKGMTGAPMKGTAFKGMRKINRGSRTADAVQAAGAAQAAQEMNRRRKKKSKDTY